MFSLGRGLAVRSLGLSSTTTGMNDGQKPNHQRCHTSAFGSTSTQACFNTFLCKGECASSRDFNRRGGFRVVPDSGRHRSGLNEQKVGC